MKNESQISRLILVSILIGNPPTAYTVQGVKAKSMYASLLHSYVNSRDAYSSLLNPVHIHNMGIGYVAIMYCERPAPSSVC